MQDLYDQTYDPATEICITSGADLTTDSAPSAVFRLDDVADVAVAPMLAAGEKCWMILPEVTAAVDAPTLCGRCRNAID